MSLRSTIHQIKLRDGDSEAIGSDAAAFLQIWRDDLIALYEEVRNLLSALEKDQLLEFDFVTYNLDEERLGKYAAPGMVLKIANRTICLAPQARLTTDGAGRIDMYKKSNPSSDARLYIVRRIEDDGSMTWLVERKDKKKDLPFGLMQLHALQLTERRYADLSTAALEDALDFLLTG